MSESLKTAEGRANWVLLAAVLGSSMAFIDATAVNVALPAIQREFNADAASLQWVVEGYALFLSSLTLIGGALGDIFGRRKMFMLGIGVFALASLICALAPSMAILNFARALQGIAAALATPGSLALISANFAPADRGKAIGTWSGFGAMTAAIGPLLGGWLAQHASWRDVFVVNIPLAIAVIGICSRKIPESRSDDPSRAVDYGGAALACVSFGSATYALISAQVSGFGGREALLLAIGAVLFGAFIAWERRAAHPMVRLEYFRNRTFAAANVYTFLLYAALGGSLFFVPINLQNIQGYTPSAAGGAMLPFIVIMFLGSRWSGGLVGKIGARTPLIIGAIIAAAGFLAYARCGVGGSYWLTFFPSACLLGIGGTFFVAPLTTTVMTALDSSAAGVASGINNALSRLAGLFAIALLGLVLSAGFYQVFEMRRSGLPLRPLTGQILREAHATLVTGRVPTGLDPADQSTLSSLIQVAYAQGFHDVMIASALLALLAALTAFVLLPAHDRTLTETIPLDK